MKKPIGLLLCLLTTFTLFAQFSSKKTEKFIEQMRVDWGVPGLAVGIIKDGQVEMNMGFGVLKKGEPGKVDANTQFAIASNTKAFVAAALANLVAQGLISWEDPVIEYLPFFELFDPYTTKNTTIKDLLCHRVGLGTFSGDVMWYKSELSPEDVIKRIKFLPQAYPFRSGYGYSNLMFITAGEVIKSVTGKSWDVFVKETFLSPLDMNRTVSSITSIDAGNSATPHKSAENNQPIPWVKWDNMGAAGGLISTTTDMLKWIRMNLDQGIWDDRTILSADQQRVMWTPHNSFTISEESEKSLPGRHFNGYGLGWGLSDYFGRMLVTHSGGYDGMYSRVMMMPDENLGIVVLTNSMSGISMPLCLQIINFFIKEDTRNWSEEMLKEKDTGPGIKQQLKDAKLDNTEPTLPIANYVGEYETDLHGGLRVILKNDQLRLIFEQAPELNADLTHWHHDTWQINWDQTHAWFDFGLISFELNDLMEVTGMKMNVPNGDIFFDEMTITKKD